MAKSKVELSDVNFQSHSILVHLKIGRWSARKADRQVASEVATQKRADRNVGKYYKTILRSNALKEYDQICDRARALDYNLTFNWSGPMHLLPAKLLDRYIEEMGKLRMEAEQKIEDFAAEYDDCRKQAKKFLGDLFNAKDYPSVEIAKQKFYFRYTMFPVPSSSDFRVDLMSKQRKTIEKEMAEHFNEVHQQMLEQLWGKVYRLVEKARNKLTKEKDVFRDSLITNIREFVDLLPDLNITNDKHIARMTDEVRKKLAAHDPDAIRLDPALRSRVASDADKILSKMAGFVGEDVLKKAA